MEEQIINFIKSDIHNNRQDIQIAPEDDLLMSGLLVSMDMIRLIEFLEKTYSVSIPPQDMNIDNFISVAAMAVYINSQLSLT